MSNAYYFYFPKLKDETLNSNLELFLNDKNLKAIKKVLEEGHQIIFILKEEQDKEILKNAGFSKNEYKAILIYTQVKLKFDTNELMAQAIAFQVLNWAQVENHCIYHKCENLELITQIEKQFNFVEKELFIVDMMPNEEIFQHHIQEDTQETIKKTHDPVVNIISPFKAIRSIDAYFLSDSLDSKPCQQLSVAFKQILYAIREYDEKQTNDIINEIKGSENFQQHINDLIYVFNDYDGQIAKSLLMRMANNGMTLSAKLLLQSGANPKIGYDVANLLKYNNHSTFLPIFSPLYLASKNSDIDTVKLLVDEWSSEIHHGCQTKPLGIEDILKLETEHENDIDIGTPLCIAVINNNLEITKYLCSKGALNQENNWKQFLSLLTTTENQKIIQYLKDYRNKVLKARSRLIPEKIYGLMTTQNELHPNEFMNNALTLFLDEKNGNTSINSEFLKKKY